MILHQHKCPACSSHLESDDDGSGRFISWCNNPRCPSELGDNGALGDTPDDAAKKLIEQMNEERDWE